MIAIALGLLAACASVMAAPSPYPGAQPAPSAYPSAYPSAAYGVGPRASNAGPDPGPLAAGSPNFFGGGYGYGGFGRGCGCGGGFVEEIIVEQPYYGGYYGGYPYGGYSNFF